MKDYVEILKKDQEIKIINYSLVNVMGTLIGFNGTFNKKLYDAMLEAHEEGEKILLYSASPPFYLKRAVDLKKFPCICSYILLSPEKHMLMGKIVDDNFKKVPSFQLSNEENYIDPNKVNEFSFSRDEIPEGLENPFFTEDDPLFKEPSFWNRVNK